MRLARQLAPLFLALIGCGGEYDVRISFVDADTMLAADRVQVAIIADCAVQTLGEAPRETVRSVEFRIGESSPALGAVEPGAYGLYARASNTECDVVAAGCTPISLDGNAEATLTVQLRNVSAQLCTGRSMCADGLCEDLDGGLMADVVDAIPSDVPDAGPPNPPPPPSMECWVQTETCDWTTPGFRFDEVLTGSFTNYEAGNVAFSPDACELLYALQVDGPFDVFRSARTSAGGEFGPAVPIAEVNLPGVSDEAPSLGPDGLELFIASTRVASRLRRVHRFARVSTSDPWGTGVPIPTLQIADTNGWEPRLAPHGLRLYVALEESDEQWLHVVERDALSAEFGEPARIPFAFSAGSNTNRPSVTQDGRVLVFIQQVGEDSNSRRAYYATRADWRADWGPAIMLPAAVGAAGMRDIGVSPDGCELVARTSTASTARSTILRYVEP